MFTATLTTLLVSLFRLAVLWRAETLRWRVYISAETTNCQPHGSVLERARRWTSMQEFHVIRVEVSFGPQRDVWAESRRGLSLAPGINWQEGHLTAASAKNRDSSNLLSSFRPETKWHSRAGHTLSEIWRRRHRHQQPADCDAAVWWTVYTLQAQGRNYQVPHTTATIPYLN